MWRNQVIIYSKWASIVLSVSNLGCELWVRLFLAYENGFLWHIKCFVSLSQSLKKFAWFLMFGIQPHMKSSHTKIGTYSNWQTKGNQMLKSVGLNRQVGNWFATNRWTGWAMAIAHVWNWLKLPENCYKIQKLQSQSPKCQIPTILQVLGIPNKSNFCPNQLAEIPKIGKIPTI